MNTKPNDVASVIYTQKQVPLYTMDVLRARLTSDTVSVLSGVSALDKVLRPLLPGELCVILARTSNYKTGFMTYWSRQIASRIVPPADPDDDYAQARQIVIYATWETAVEELGVYDLAADTGINANHIWYDDITPLEMRTLEDAAKRRARQPVWVIGHSITRRRTMKALTLPVVSQALLNIEDTYNSHPAAIFLDYLQEIPPLQGEDRREKVLYNVERAKQLARDLGCPVILGVQAGRQCDDREFKLPEIGDGQETSRIEQAADKMIALWMPKTTERIGDVIEGLDLQVTPNLLVVGLRKQRFGESGQVFPLFVDPAKNTISSMTSEQMAW